jgi:hypothetical protein
VIIETIFNFLMTTLETVFGWVSLPEFPAQLAATVEGFEDLIFGNTQMLSFFVRISTVKILVPLVIVVVNFDKVWKLTMFILRKIPMLGIE